MKAVLSVCGLRSNFKISLLSILFGARSEAVTWPEADESTVVPVGEDEPGRSTALFPLGLPCGDGGLFFCLVGAGARWSGALRSPKTSCRWASRCRSAFSMPLSTGFGWEVRPLGRFAAGGGLGTGRGGGAGTALGAGPPCASARLRASRRRAACRRKSFRSSAMMSFTFRRFAGPSVCFDSRYRRWLVAFRYRRRHS